MDTLSLYPGPNVWIPTEPSNHRRNNGIKMEDILRSKTLITDSADYKNHGNNTYEAVLSSPETARTL